MREAEEFERLWFPLPSLLSAVGRKTTFNLLGHAARKVIECVSKQTGMRPSAICAQATCPLSLATSVKAGLDVDWSDLATKSTLQAIWLQS